MSALRSLASRRPFAVALLLALACLLVPYRSLLGPGVPSGRDLLPYFYPLKAHLVEAVRAGEVPWVDRFRQGGLPLLASPGVAAFDPGNVLFLLLPLATAAKAWMLLRVLAGAAGFGLFLRVSGLPPLASALGALAWGAGGVAASSASFLGLSSAHAMLPWLAAGLLHARSRRAPRAVALLAVAAALFVVAAVPEPLVSGALLALVLLAGKGDGPAFRERAGAAALWCAAALLGAALAAPALGAFLVTGLEGIRGTKGALADGFAAQGSLPAARLGELLVDGVVADWSKTANAEGVPEYPYFPSLTPGRVAWTLALVGLVAGRGARLRASALALLGVLLALGPATPLFGLLRSAMPFAASLRYPEKYAVLFAFGLAWLAAVGAAALESALGESRARPAFALLALLVVLDRAGTVRDLLPMAPERLVGARPEVLAALPASTGPATPPRVFAETGYRIPMGAGPEDRASEGPHMVRWAFPFTPGLFGVGTVLERDYDLTLPRAQLDWVLLLERTGAGSPVPAALARSAGALAVVTAEAGASGRSVPVLRPFAEPVPPFRFVRRVARAADVSLAAERLLGEGAPVDTAFLVGEGPAVVPGPGRVLSVSDRPSGLELVVSVPGPAPAYLLVCRPRVAALRASLDGRPVVTEEANLGYTGLAVPPGEHVVRLQPMGRWLIIAAVLSILGLAASAALFRESRGGRSR